MAQAKIPNPEAFSSHPLKSIPVPAGVPMHFDDLLWDGSHFTLLCTRILPDGAIKNFQLSASYFQKSITLGALKLAHVIV